MCIRDSMAEAARTIPHFSYVEEIDVTELESLRTPRNSKAPKGTPSLTYLPFLAAALARVLEEFPQCNAHYDAERNVLIRHRPVHLGVPTQTADGLKVPVVRHAEARSLCDLPHELRPVSEAAKSATSSRQPTARKGTLFLFDEPTTGLHFDDIAKLMRAFRKLLDAGHSLIVIEHNLDVIRASDWLIDLGPEGGDAGGRIVAEGTPETVMATERSYTGQVLHPGLTGKEGKQPAEVDEALAAVGD